MSRVAVPERLSLAALRGFLSALDGVEGVALLVGEGRGFCQGMDLGSVESDPTEAFELFSQAMGMLHSWPCVAFVDGEARGGGVGLAAACDVVLATPGSSFALPEALLGLVPGAIMPALQERMSPQKVRRLSLTGLAVGAEEALRLGLVDAIVETERDARQWTRALARTEPAAAGVVRRMLDDGFAEAVARGGAETRARIADPETKRRIAVFLDGGAPWSM